jgi:hypothetical protein
MPRILVMSEPSERSEAPVLLNEAVRPEHLLDEHAAAQLIERIGWAVTDASDIERQRRSFAARD